MTKIKRLDNKWTLMLAVIWLGVFTAQIVSPAGTTTFCITPTPSAYSFDTTAAYGSVHPTQ